MRIGKLTAVNLPSVLPQNRPLRNCLLIRPAGGTLAKGQVKLEGYSLAGGMEIFRHCPQCGHRFHIKLEDKTLTGTERISAPSDRYRTVTGMPLTYDIRDFRYTYKCEECGHEWSETGIDENVEK